jgi:hypothetical protein
MKKILCHFLLVVLVSGCIRRPLTPEEFRTWFVTFSQTMNECAAPSLFLAYAVNEAEMLPVETLHALSSAISERCEVAERLNFPDQALGSCSKAAERSGFLARSFVEHAYSIDDQLAKDTRVISLSAEVANHWKKCDTTARQTFQKFNPDWTNTGLIYYNIQHDMTPRSDVFLD